MRVRVISFAVLAIVVLLVGLNEIDAQPYWGASAYQRYNVRLPGDGSQSVVALLLGAGAIAVAGRWAGAGLALLWLLLGFHWLASAPLLLAELAVLSVGFACAAWGTRRTVLLAGLSVPAAALACVAFVFWFSDQYPGAFLAQLKLWGINQAAYDVLDSGWGPVAVLCTVALLCLATPWLAGLLLRSRVQAAAARVANERAEASRAVAEQARVAAVQERDQAAELAQLREAQTQLSRDVHDVVGHSLTVILAQAEAAQFATDAEMLKRTMVTITDTARSSLADVRQVLQQIRGGAAPVPVEADLQALLEGVRAGGRTVDLRDDGDPRPLPPDLAPVAHRVLQEMLTNAVRHGDPAGRIWVHRTWASNLTLSVTNAVPAPGDTAPLAASVPESGSGGQGLEGMRRRLEQAGGRLEVQRSVHPPTFTTTATVPLPGREDLP